MKKYLQTQIRKNTICKDSQPGGKNQMVFRLLIGKLISGTAIMMVGLLNQKYNQEMYHIINRENEDERYTW